MLFMCGVSVDLRGVRPAAVCVAAARVELLQDALQGREGAGAAGRRPHPRPGGARALPPPSSG